MGRPTERDEPSMVIEILPARPNATVELETADLKELAQHGTLAVPRQVAKQATVAVAKVVVERQEDSIVIELPERESSASIARPGTPINVRRVTPARPRVHVDHATKKQPASGGLWLVVLIYVVSASALGLSIYYRFIA